MPYKWDTPQEWLQAKIAETTDLETLRGFVRSALDLLDADQVQDVFQDEMDDDGFFNDDDTPTEPEEGDYTMSSVGPLGCHTAVSQYGKHLGTFRREDSAENFIRERGNNEKFWPNVWRISDHGNAELLEFDWWVWVDTSDANNFSI